MFRPPKFLWALLLPSVLSQNTGPASRGGGTLDSVQTVSLDLSDTFNIKAASTGTSDSFANFDGSGRAYPAEYLPKSSTFEYNGIQFTVPPFHESSAHDAIRSDSQVINVPGNKTRFHSFHALATSVWPPSGSASARTGNLVFGFDDGTTATTEILVGPWWSMNPFNGPIHTPFHYANTTLDGMSVNHNVTSISYVSTRIPNDKPLKSITLPVDTSYINFFAISLISVPGDTGHTASTSESGTGPNLNVQGVRSTTKWFDNTNPGSRIQRIEVTLANLSPLSAPATTSWVTSPHTITLVSPNSDIETVNVGSFHRLRSNDQVVIPVGIRNSPRVPPGSKIKVRVQINSDSGFESLLGHPSAQTEFEITAGIPEWNDTDESLSTHEIPDWYEDAKFGIFVHWGVYSVPAWAPSGKQYAEWYNWDFHNPPNSDNPTWEHHLQTYGEDVVYDDFIANFTASAWNPDDWTDLFSDAGAKYFVFVTKHHDGFAMFDTKNSSNRNSLLLGPKRDFLKDLFDSAKDRHPELHRGTYFSLPEWFNPAYAEYGFGSWPGGGALNAFNGTCCDPYIGYVPVDDYLEQIQKPQMSSLLFEYDIDILWCDIGGPSTFPQLGASWYNHAASQNRQVVMNNRCGANQSDFVTPEYATFSALLSQKWESNAGMDPFSYGYNSDTPSNAYQNATSVLTELIDIVSKGGNFLLDIGPKEDGSVILEEAEPLRQVGQWLKAAGESIYGTRPWFIQPEDISEGSTNVRFTTKPDAFYIIAISRPSNGILKTTAPVPIKEGDKVTLLGGNGDILKWSVTDGTLTVDVDGDELDKIPLPAWAFKVEYSTT